VEWYTGRTENDAATCVERALDPDFEMVTPAGYRRTYGGVVDGIRGRYATHDRGSFEIGVRHVATRHTFEEHCSVRCEEWQTTPGETTGRLSTVLFGADAGAPGGVVWCDLQGTWLDDGP
jgi:hypothetical protein